MGDEAFNDYLDAQPEPQRTTLLTVASSLRSLLPSAEARISYGMPAFAVDGTAVAGFAGFTRHCSYFPHSGGVLERLTDELAGYDYDRGTLRFAVDAPLPKSLLRRLVGVRLALESERVTSRGAVRRFYDNGVVQSKGRMVDSELHGDWVWYRKDGTLMRSGRFRNGTRIGVWQTFDRHGALVKQTTFR